jgi:hypothetical protein
VIFYALLELAAQKAYGIVQDVFLLGATLTASTKSWCEARSVVSGRFVNGYARNDWVLNYLFRATSGGLSTVAGLRPIENVSGLENVDVTDKISGHMSYRAFMPLILDQLGFPVSADYFDEPEVRASLQGILDLTPYRLVPLGTRFRRGEDCCWEWRRRAQEAWLVFEEKDYADTTTCFRTSNTSSFRRADQESSLVNRYRGCLTTSGAEGFCANFSLRVDDRQYRGGGIDV